jgi:hypothetical protein
VVFVACVDAELEGLEALVVLPPVVAAAELDADALSLVWLLDVEALDCVAEEDWEPEGKNCQPEKRFVLVPYILLLWAFCRLRIKPEISSCDPGHGQEAEKVVKRRSERREKMLTLFMVGN